MRRLTKLGLLLTGSWLLLFLAIVFLNFDYATMMSLNELGDFLAGASAPMALLWLVIGYFQHGEELRLNTKALEAQQEELRQQVAETALLAQNSERHAEATEKLALLSRLEQEREAQREAREATPEFVKRGSSISGDKISIEVQNRGGEAREFELNYDGDHTLVFSPMTILETGQVGKFVLRQQRNIRLDFPILFSLQCVDLLGNVHKYDVELTENANLQIVSLKSS